MGEPYPIKVIHIVNPHMIFIESRVQKHKPVFEQVGLYGVLPGTISLEADGKVKPEICEHWPVAANNIFHEILGGKNDGVFFVPIQVDERRTIFDDNIYKFGDIIIETKNNIISVTEHLIRTPIAIKNQVTFLQKLKTGSLNLKIDTAQTENILNTIKRYYKKHNVADSDWEGTLRKQTVLHEKKKQLMNELNETFKLVVDTSVLNISNILEMKQKDFELCQDADLVSVGRGTRHVSYPNCNTLVKDDSNLIINDVKLILNIYQRKKILKQVKETNKLVNIETVSSSVESDSDWDDITV